MSSIMAKASRQLGRLTVALIATGMLPGGAVVSLVLAPPHRAMAEETLAAPTSEVTQAIELAAGAEVVFITGVIDLRTAWAVYELPATVRLAVLDSPGGVVYEGARLAQEFRRRGLTTYVPAGGRCLSICTLAFQGGARRLAHPDAAFGYHGAGLAPDRLVGPEQLIAPENDIAHRLRLGRVNALLRAYYLMYDAPRDLIETAVLTPPSRFLVKTPSELLLAGVVDAVVDLDL